MSYSVLENFQNSHSLQSYSGHEFNILTIPRNNILNATLCSKETEIEKQNNTKTQCQKTRVDCTINYIA